MMEAAPRKGREIQRIWREKDTLFLKQEAGLLRLEPWAEGILRVSYTQEDAFPVLPGYEGRDPGTAWDWQKGNDRVLLSAESFQAEVSSSTGSLRVLGKDGRALFAERAWESRQTEGFDAFRTVEDPDAVVEEIQTADGVKRRTRDASRVFDRRLYHTALHMEFQPGERLFGLGQAEEGTWDLRHTTQYLHQANRKIAVPVLVSDRGYGLMLTAQSPVIFDDTAYGSYLYAEAAPCLDYFFLAGNLRQVVRGIRLLTGKAAMLPEWAFGYMQSQERYESEGELLDTAGRFRETGFGMDTLVLDWMSWPDGQWGQKSFDRERFSEPSRMMESLHRTDTHLMISIWPNMDPRCENYREFKEAGLLLPNSNIYDAFSAEGRKLYWEQVKRGLFRHGVDAWWCDSSEPVTPEWTRDVKPPAPEMYRAYVEEAGKIMPADKGNAFGLYHAKGIYEGQRGETEEKRVVNLTRSGYPGIQKYGAILWSGDISASWETLRKQITAGLQFCVCGLPYWTLDIGAFFVKNGPQWFWNGDYPEGLADPAYRELYVRWFQYGAFLPVFRSHGTDVRREPWNFGGPGEVFYDALLAADRLRYRLMPYLYSLAGDVWRNDSLMMRPLFYDFPEDGAAADISCQYMLGPALLVCPVARPMAGSPWAKEPSAKDGAAEAAETLTVYLPGGTDWYDLYTEQRFQGGRRVSIRVSMDRIPVFVRAGSVLPLAQPGRSTAEQKDSALELRAYPGADGMFPLYEDAGDGYGYEKGEYCVTELFYSDALRRVEWKTTGDPSYRRRELRVRIVK